MPIVAAIGLVLASMSACSEPSSPSEDAAFEALSDEGWAYGDTLHFPISDEVADSLGSARMALCVRHSDAYLYSNLWLEVSTPVAGTDSMRVDTVNVALADVYGKWYGKGVGVSFIKTDTLHGRYEFDKRRPASVRHIMRLDTLRDLEQIGLVFFDLKSDSI